MARKATRLIRRAFEKNFPEVKAFFTGQMPSFIVSSGSSTSFDEVPVFVFHDVEPERFNDQLLYLQHNGYETLDADELEAAIRDKKQEKRAIALTFDDATWTFWTYVFPLLKKYNARAILFAIPGLILDDSTSYPNLEDVWASRCSPEDLRRREKLQPLCTWHEMAIMNDSGVVDIQSHSLTHSRASISRRLVDFLNPGFDTYYFNNIDIPVSSLDNPELPERKLRLGAPVFDSISRMKCLPRFKENSDLIKAMTCHVSEHGSSAFFEQPGWGKELKSLFRQCPVDSLGSFESQEETESAVRRELTESKRILEENLSTKEVRHFCYPWYEGSDRTDRLAAEAGYRTLHYGIEVNNQNTRDTETTRIRRISEEYFFRLPGEGRRSVASVWLHRTSHLWGRAKSSTG